MKKNFAVITMLLFSIDQYSCSQTLPTVQSTNVRSPTDLKVDGKSTEWGDKYQAYNKSTDIFYTISNDDINLYLIVHATNPRIIQKIIYVGLTLTINSNEKNNIKDPENTGVTYPLLNTRDGA